MTVAKSIVSRPTTVLIIFLLLIGLGVFSLANLSVDLYPEINFPVLVVIAPFPGAGPEEVERSLVRPLEAAFAGISGLEEITSTSSQNSGLVMLQFTFGSDLADASNSVRDALERIRNVIPAGADTPMIFRFDPAMIPIVGFMISGRRSAEELRELAEDIIVPRIEQTPGVATAMIVGGRERIIRVEIPQNRLEAYGLTITQIQQVIAAQNVQIAAGTIIENDLSFILTTMGEFTSLDQIRNTVISHTGGGMFGGQLELPRRVYLRDLADVFEGYRDQLSAVFVDGESAVMTLVQRQSGANSVQAANDLRARVQAMSRDLPPDINIIELFNTTDIVENSLNQVTFTALYGAILCVLVLFLFLRALKPTLIIGISIPVSVSITLMLMYFFDLTLNLMTMAGLILGIGMLVDNSIVILENIYHYREKGAKLKTSAILGTKEMLLAIATATLTTICVFAPLVMFQGILGVAGEMFAGLAFTVVISLTISLFTAVFLVPVLASHFLPLVTRRQKPLTGNLAKVDGVFAGFLKWLDNSYRRAVDRILRRKAIVIITVSVLFVGSILLVPVVGWVFMPPQEDDNVIVRATLPMGTPLPQTEAVLRQLEMIIRNEVQGFEALIINAGGGGFFGGATSHSGTLRVNLPPFRDRTETAEDIRNVFRRHFDSFPGVAFTFESGFGGGGGGMGGSPIQITLRTDDLVRGKIMADRIADLLSERLVEITEPEVDLDDGLPQIEITINRETMYALGLNAFTVGNEIRAAVDGITATRFRSGGRDYDVVLILAEADRSTRPALDQIFINSHLAGRVPLSSFVHYEEGTGPITIRRENQSRVINITAGVVPGTRVNILQAQVEALIASEIPVEDDIIIEFGGDQAEMLEMLRNFILIAVVAIALVFGIMASLFESFKAPFIIIFTIPLSFVGIVAIYLISGDTFNVLTAVGLLVLIGVITNNGIVLVDYTNLLRKRGMPLHEACVEAAGNRLRPILMTTISTVLGLVPMAFFPGEGSEWIAPIGKTVLGGLSFGTLMTLFLMPTMYYIMNRRSDERAAKALARRERIAAGLRRKDIKAQEAALGAGASGQTLLGGATLTGQSPTEEANR
ncbi:MAG: efflux RND transporter permease subunit [Treponema sp.]|nr:efflux RND transporter permease subunit [Treponema sp.]